MLKALGIGSVNLSGYSRPGLRRGRSRRLRRSKELQNSASRSSTMKIARRPARNARAASSSRLYQDIEAAICRRRTPPNSTVLDDTPKKNFGITEEVADRHAATRADPTRKVMERLVHNMEADNGKPAGSPRQTRRFMMPSCCSLPNLCRTTLAAPPRRLEQTWRKGLPRT